MENKKSNTMNVFRAETNTLIKTYSNTIDGVISQLNNVVIEPEAFKMFKESSKFVKNDGELMKRFDAISASNNHTITCLSIARDVESMILNAKNINESLNGDINVDDILTKMNAIHDALSSARNMMLELQTEINTDRHIIKSVL